MEARRFWYVRLWKKAGLLIVYQLIRTETEILIVVIGVREDSEVYETAQKRIHRHDL